jgi:hypothetical protein
MSGKTIAGLGFILLALIIGYDLYKNRIKPFNSNNYKLYGVVIIGFWLGIYFVFFFDK